MQAILGLVAVIGLTAILALLSSVLGMGLLFGLLGQPAAPVVTPAPPIATPSPESTRTPEPTPTPTPTATPTPTPAATATPEESEPAGLLPATNLLIEDGGEPGAFIVHWDYPQEGPVVPEGFDVVIDGEVYEPTSYEGTDFEYSWYVGEQECGTTVDVEIVAVNGDQRSSSGAVPAETGGC